MIRGYLIGESMRPGSRLEKLKATLVDVERHPVKNAVPNQPNVWTVVHFDSADEPERLAASLAEVLDDAPSHWYTDFKAGDEKFVIFPKRVFRYRIGDRARREEAQDYARSIGIPPRQVDWEE